MGTSSTSPLARWQFFARANGRMLLVRASSPPAPCSLARANNSLPACWREGICTGWVPTQPSLVEEDGAPGLGATRVAQMLVKSCGTQ